MSKHPLDLFIAAEIKVDPNNLAQHMSNLRYDALAEFLRNLGDCLAIAGKADADRNRPKLAMALYEASVNLRDAGKCVDAAWDICAPHMPEE